jgi:hypothetical protein
MFPLSAVLLTIPAADAPDRLISPHGVEQVMDEEVFVLFAALNALGYSEETERKGPPLRAPVFHPIRVKVQDALRKADKKGGTDSIKRMFDENPAEIETYLEAVLSRAAKARGASKEAQKLERALVALEAFRSDAELTALFDELAEEQRSLGLQLEQKIEKELDAAGKLIGAKDLRAPSDLVVVPNPLDAHDVVREVEIGKVEYLVVGPGLDSANRRILLASLRPVVLRAVSEAFPKAVNLKKQWDGIKGTSRITRRFATPEAYLAESLAHAVVYRARGKRNDRDADEEFVDDQAKAGLRWGRVALSLLDESNGALADGLHRLFPKATP